MLATYAGAASPGDGRDARVGGQVGGAVEPGDVAGDGQQDLACGPDRDSGYTGQDREKRVVLQKGLDLGGELFALFAQLADAGGEYGDDLLDGLGAGHGHVLLANGVEQVVDDAAAASESCALGPFAHACTAGAPHAGRPSVMFEQRQRGVARDAVALEGVFERGVDPRRQATQPVGLPVAFECQVVVESGQDLEPGHGLVVAAGVAKCVGHMQRGERDHVRVARVRLRVAGQQLGGLAHRRPRQVAHGHAHVARYGQRQRADRVRLVHDQQHVAMTAQTCEQFADLRLVLPQRLVDDALSVPVERARVMGLLAHVQSQPYVDVVVSHGEASLSPDSSGSPCRLA